jgi:methionine-gamma-lyase
MKKKIQSIHKATKAIRAGHLEKSVFGEISVPIFQSSTFAFPSAQEGADRIEGKTGGYVYTRFGN